MYRFCAYLITSLAADAFGFIIQELFFTALGFGIVTPFATERTPLEEHRSSHTGAVMHTEALYLGYVKLNAIILHFVVSPYPANLDSS